MITKNEIDIMNQIRLDASEAGIILWRNNTGAFINPDGRLIRYGLANDSARINQRIKSSDLIGFTPKRISKKDINKTIAVFTAIEVKYPGWKYRNTKSDKAQLAFLKLINKSGGIAYYSTGGLIL